jgi:cell wall-associated NlpC family hydrolase
MTDVTDPRRLKVVEEARSWLGTPYHHMARVKGAGTDCLMMLVAVYHAAGIIPDIHVPFYPPDWNLHRDAERYYEGLVQYAREISRAPEPGDVALFKFGRCFAHGAVVVAWPLVIHAWSGAGVIWGDARQPQLADRPVKFFDPF